MSMKLYEKTLYIIAVLLIISLIFILFSSDYSPFVSMVDSLTAAAVWLLIGIVRFRTNRVSSIVSFAVGVFILVMTLAHF
jgi:hypothetical protein